MAISIFTDTTQHLIKYLPLYQALHRVSFPLPWRHTLTHYHWHGLLLNIAYQLIWAGAYFDATWHDNYYQRTLLHLVCGSSHPHAMRLTRLFVEGETREINGRQVTLGGSAALNALEGDSATSLHYAASRGEGNYTNSLFTGARR
jgi:hypothetical protein